MSQIASSYPHLETFLADLALENPEEERKGGRDDAVVLSTVHSAKGLEWPAVLVIDRLQRHTGLELFQAPGRSGPQRLVLRQGDHQRPA